MPDDWEPVRRNAFLNQLADCTLAALMSSAVVVDRVSRQVLYEPLNGIASVNFPIDGLVSLMALHRDGGMVECGVVGSEGIVGLGALLGFSATPFSAVVTVPGRSIEVAANSAREWMESDQRVVHLVERYSGFRLEQMALNAACLARHSLTARLARWLLTASDLAGDATIAITHQELAQILGGHRPSTTQAAINLRDAGCLRYRRGRVVVADRSLLLEEACECYEINRELLALAETA